MAKGDDKRVRTAIDQETTRSNTQNQQMYNQFQNQYQDALSSDQKIKTGVTDNLLNFKPNYDADEYLKAAGYGGSGSGGDGGAGGTAFSIARGIDPSLISGMGAEAYSGFRNLAQGLDSRFWNDYNQYKTGLDSAIAGYQDFANTGGYSPEALNAIREQAIAPTRMIYKQGQEQAQLANQRAGGNLANIAAAQARMTRDSNQAISDASVANEANMARLVQEGKLAGLSGLTGATTAGMNARTQVEALDAQMRNNGLQGMSDIEKNRLAAYLENQNLTQRGDIAEAQLAESAAGRAASAAAAARADALREAMWRGDLAALGNQQFLQGQGQLTDLYGTTPAATALANRSLLDLYNSGNQHNTNLINSRIAGSQIPGTFETVMGRIGSVGQVAGQIAGSIMGLPNLSGSQMVEESSPTSIHSR